MARLSPMIWAAGVGLLVVVSALVVLLLVGVSSSKKDRLRQ
jgi:hypothetical protein